MKGRAAALVLLAPALGLALIHPWGPVTVGAALLLFACVSWYAPQQLLLMLLAMLPVASFAPQTGWIFVQEIDLLVMAGCAGAYWRSLELAPPGWTDPAAVGKGDAGDALARSGMRISLPLLGVLALVGSQALAAAVAWHNQPWAWSDLQPWGSYRSPAASLVGLKGAWLLAVLAPYVDRELQRDAHALGLQVGRGMALGLLLCGAVVLRERLRFTGLWNLDLPYRATGPFWEMHIGGAALDGYLALSAPFALFLLLQERSRPWWFVAAAALLVGAYAAVASSSRIPYASMAASLGVMLIAAGLVWRRQRAARGHERALCSGVGEGSGRAVRAPRAPWVRAGFVVALLCGALLGWAVNSSGFLHKRFSLAEKDLEVRERHWVEVLELLRSPTQALVGLGAGQYIVHWQNRTPDAPRLKPGDHQWVEAPGGPHLHLHRSENARHSGELYRLLQWVTIPADRLPDNLQFSGLYRTPAGPVRLEVKLCARHLLYTQHCRWVIAPVDSTPAEDWRPVRLDLRWLAPLPTRSAYLDGPWALSIAVRSGAEMVELKQLSLRGANGVELMRNGDLARGLNGWFFSSDAGHLEWNTQNMGLHVLVEQGGVGLSVLVALLFSAVGWGWRSGAALSPFRITLLASLAGVMVVGVMDALVNHGRLWLLVYGLLLLAISGEASGGSVRRPPPTS